MEEVARTLRPVRPLSSPESRALLLLPLGILVLAAVPLIWRPRVDAARLGVMRLWGGSAVQLGVSLFVLAAALAEAVPGRLPSLRQVGVRFVVGLGCMVGLTFVTFLASPSSVPPLLQTRYVRACSLGSFSVGLVPLALVGLLMRAGLSSRPVVAGAMAGLGSGLMADAGWRLYCHASDPAHVLTAHLAGVAGLCLVSVLAGASRRRRGAPGPMLPRS